MLQRQNQCGIKLRPKKYEVFKREVCFVGLIISEHGYSMNPKEIKVVQALKWEMPSTVCEVRKLMGFLDYDRSYIADFAKRAKPLYELLTKPSMCKMKGSGKKGNPSSQASPSQPVEWTGRHQEALEKLIAELSSPPMAYPDFEKPYVLYVDASEEGLGAVLYQRQGGKLFHAPHFTVYSDNNTLTYVMKTAKLNAAGQRWVSELADYHFTLKYRPGTANRDEDFLSWRPVPIEVTVKECTQECEPEVLGSIGEALKAQRWEEVNWISVITCNIDVLPEELKGGSETSRQLTRQDIRNAQLSDPVIGRVLELKKKQLYLKHRDKLKQPEAVALNFKRMIYKYLHEDMAHLGADRLMAAARARFFWPRMREKKQKT